MALQTIARCRDRSIKVLLLRRNRQNHESSAESRVDRSNLASPLLRPQLEQIRLTLQRLHMRRRQIRPEILQLLHDVEDRLAISAGLHVLEVDDRIAVEVDNPGSRLLCHSSDISRGRGLNVLSSDREVSAPPRPSGYELDPLDRLDYVEPSFKRIHEIELREDRLEGSPSAVVSMPFVVTQTRLSAKLARTIRRVR